MTLWVVWALTGAGYPWPVWLTGACGLGLLVNRWAAVEIRRDTTAPPKLNRSATVGGVGTWGVESASAGGCSRTEAVMAPAKHHGQRWSSVKGRTLAQWFSAATTNVWR